jgi:hypothetical protein
MHIFGQEKWITAFNPSGVIEQWDNCSYRSLGHFAFAK